MRTTPPVTTEPVFYLDGVLVTNVVNFELGPKGYVVIELRDDDGSERVTRTGRVEQRYASTVTAPQEYAGAMP